MNDPITRKNLKNRSFGYKLAAIDLDGTLLDENKNISKKNVQALRMLEEAGVTVVLASGRTHDSIMNFTSELDLTGPIISSHGALVKDYKTQRVLSFNSLKPDAAKKLVIEAERQNVTVIYCHLNGVFINQRNEWTSLFEQRSRKEANFIDSFDSLHAADPYKIIWMHRPEKLSSIHSGLDKHFKDEYYIARGDAEHLEFLAINTSKAVGLEAVAKHLGISKDETISFGDADNDIPMLAWAGLGIAMNHATDGAKTAANIVAAVGPMETNFASAVEAVFAYTRSQGE